MEWPERNLSIGWAGSYANYTLWTPERAPLRKTGRFRAYVQAAGMVDYWRARGWADLRSPADSGDFVCT